MTSTREKLGIVWFRQDLRLADNPALQAACEQCESVLCVFIDDPMEQSCSRLGAASRVWLHHSLAALNQSLLPMNQRLFFFQGASQDLLSQLCAETGASRLYWNRCYDPKSIERDKRIKSALADFQPQTFNALLLFEPWVNLKADNSPYRVYTPYWRAASSLISQKPEVLQALEAPADIPGSSEVLQQQFTQSLELSELDLLPRKHWHQGMMSHWQVGESAAMDALERFLSQPVHDYASGRDLPAVTGTSRLSPHLHIGEISPRQILQRLLNGRRIDKLNDSETVFAKEIVWREFAYSLLYHFPHTIDKPLDVRFEKFPWAEDTEDHLLAWQRGRTGVPIVDAGMRELYATGWMHNRVRMIVASYLIKNLLIPWQAGEHWFRDTLVDADLASNSMGWQWTAGSGADAAPFFRVFNPVLQGEKFDRDGRYVRQWVPELADVPDKYVHKPWEMVDSQDNTAEYPAPLVDLKVTRTRALDAFATIKGS